MLEDLACELLHLSWLVQALSRHKLLKVEIYCDLLLGEGEVQEEQIVHSHERDWVDEALRIKVTLKVVVFVVALDVLFKFVHVEVSLGKPLLILEVLHIRNGVLSCKTRLHIESGRFEGSVVDNGEDIGIAISGIHDLLPMVAVRVLSEKQIVDGVEQ